MVREFSAGGVVLRKMRGRWYLAVIEPHMDRPRRNLKLRKSKRTPTDAELVALPKGAIDEGEKPEQTALREVREETGYELAPSGELISLGYFFSSPGFTDERGYFFLLRPVQACAKGPDRDESESILDCRGFTSEEIRRMIAENKIRDANTLGICATLAARGLLSLAPR